MNPQGKDMVGLIWSKQEQQLPSKEEQNNSAKLQSAKK